MGEQCTKDDPRLVCSCDDCARAAARGWSSLMRRVMDEEITLADAQGQMNRVLAEPREEKG